ncbi:hypothetical protein INR49_019634 [Caranx melampygus]|nr:hypothetical protein INR49_019634 [Caranx melampygus]
MNRRRAPRRISHSQRRDAPTGGEWRQRNQEQWRGQDKAQVRQVGENERLSDVQGKETIPRGTCQTMCPAHELRIRETERRLHHFEMLAGTERDRRPRGDPSRSVKEYSRPAAGKDSTKPSDLRPPAVLLKTVYGFVFDRLRAVKQDMIIQRVSGLDCVAILEQTVRFLIYASYRLCGSARAAQHIMELPERLRSTPAIKLALSINQAFLERNPVRLLRLAQKLTFLQCCALHRHLVTCRRDLLLIFSHGYSSRNCRFPLDRLAQLLSLNASLTAQLCQAYGQEVNQDNLVVFSKAAFTEPEQGKLNCKLYHSIVDEKQRDLTVGSIIHGCA